MLLVLFPYCNYDDSVVLVIGLYACVFVFLFFLFILRRAEYRLRQCANFAGTEEDGTSAGRFYVGGSGRTLWEVLFLLPCRELEVLTCTLLGYVGILVLCCGGGRTLCKVLFLLPCRESEVLTCNRFGYVVRLWGSLYLK